MSVPLEKLQKVIAQTGFASRRQVEKLIQEGRISVDGKIATIGSRIHTKQVVRIDGQILPLDSVDGQICRVLAYYKPEGEICAREDAEGRTTVFHRLPKIKVGRWIMVGRLDINSAGLLLFTTDGELANRLMHPKYEIGREYAVRAHPELTPEQRKLLLSGVTLDDGVAQFSSVRNSGGENRNHWYHVSLKEGRNREVRRMFEAVDCQVSRLIRVRYGTVDLMKHLPRGGWIELGLDPINLLRQEVGLPKERRTFVKVEKKKRVTQRRQLAKIRHSLNKQKRKQN